MQRPVDRRSWLKGSLGAMAALGTSFVSAQARAQTRAGGNSSPPPLSPGPPSPGPAPSQDLEVRDVRVAGDRALGRRFLLFRPKVVPPDARLPLLVLLHGLGETIDETIGVRAWVDRYGLGTAYDRLRRPPVARTFKARKDFSDERLAAVNDDLMRGPFEGFVIACPYTPKATKAPELDQYAAWIVETVIPRARQEVPIHSDANMVAIDGCSLGGFLGLEVFVRFPSAFGAWGGVQSAISEGTAPSYAERVAKALAQSGPKALHIETSANDVFRKGNERLAAELAQRNIPSELLVIPGWHDQPWLREAGTVEMLLWHDRRFKKAAGGGAALASPTR